MNNDVKKKEPNISIVVSILIALILWIYVIGEVDPNINQHFNSIPVVVNNVQILEKNGLVLAEKQEYTVDVSVYGRTSTLYGLRNKIKATIDLSNVSSKGTYNLNVDITGIPDNVELKNVDPMEITVKVDRISSDERSVELNITGQTENGLSILDYTVNPSKVKISGPEDVLKSVSKVIADLDITNASADINQNVQLHAVDKEGNEVEGVTIDSKTSHATVNIGKTKTVNIQPTYNGQLPDGYVLTQVIIEPKQITVGAKNNLLSNLDLITTEQIELGGIKSSFEKRVGLILPNGVNILKGEPTVLIKVLIQKIESTEYKLDKVDVVNKPDNLNITYPQGHNISIVLQGKKEDLDALQTSSIHLYLDLKDIKVGENNIPLKMEEIEGFTIKSMSPTSITVNAS